MIKKTLPEKIFYCFNVLLLLSLCATIILPYIHVLMVALNDTAAVSFHGLLLWPRQFTLVNFQTLLNDDSIIRAFTVTLMRIGGTLALVISLNFMAAYALTRKGLPHRKKIVMFFFIPQYISGGLIPTYILFSALGLLNNFWVYILPAGFSFYYFILLRTYLGTIPDSLEESARIDGASEMMIMLRIYLPLSLPMIATMALMITVGVWNDWATTLFFFRGNRWNTLAYELYRVLQEQARLQELIREAVRLGQVTLAAATTTEGLRNAQIIISTLPIIMVYPFLQKYFIKGLLIGGVKE